MCFYKCPEQKQGPPRPDRCDLLLPTLSRSPVGTLAFTLPAEGSQVDSRGRYPKSHRMLEEIPGQRSKLNNIKLVEAACGGCCRPNSQRPPHQPWRHNGGCNAPLASQCGILGPRSRYLAAWSLLSRCDSAE